MPSVVQPGEFRLSPVQQMAASSSGALLTSFFTTPFDVVKVRLQAQQKLRSAAVTCLRCVHELCMCGVTTTGENVRLHYGSVGMFLNIARGEGPRHLWRGLSPSILMAVPATVIYFTLYDNVLEYSGYSASGRTQHFLPGLCGGSARVMATAAVCPIEMVRTKMQAQTSSYAELARAVRFALRTDGVASLWRGFFPMLWRDVPFSILYWTCYEAMKSRALQQGRGISTAEAFIGGATAGTLAAIATSPFDVVKTYWQVEVGEASAPVRRISLVSAMRSIVRTHGWRGLFVGMTPRVVKVAPACAVMISTYETSKTFFHQLNRNRLYHP